MATRSMSGYKAGDGHWLAKIGGWLVVPGVAALATKLLAEEVMDPTDSAETKFSKLRSCTILTHACGAMACYYGSEKVSSINAEAFLRGGMWSEMLSVATWPALELLAQKYYTQVEQLAAQGAQHPVSSVAGIDITPPAGLARFASILTAGVSDKIGQESITAGQLAHR